SGVTWGEYRLVGTYDGSSFTVLEVGPRTSSEGDAPEVTNVPCPKPDGGWVAIDPTRTAEADMQSANRLATNQPDAAGFWIKILTPGADTESHRPNDIVVIAAFTSGLEKPRQGLAALRRGAVGWVERPAPATHPP